MSKLLRHFAPGQSCFITSVTAEREPLLVNHAGLLARAVIRARARFDFTLIAWVIIPDHIHLILDTPDGNTSAIIRSVKLSFSTQYRRHIECTGPVWQHRYWDHILRSQEDLNRHINYVHFNPVKHGLVESPRDYRLSSFRQFCWIGYYDMDWRADEDLFGDQAFGE